VNDPLGEEGGSNLESVLTRAETWDPIEEAASVSRIRQALFGTATASAIAGRYVPLERIGVGGASVVYRAYDSRLHREVGLKVVSASRGDPGHSDRLLREAQTIASAAHPNIIHVYDVGRSEVGVFMAMELIDGADLERWLATDGRKAPWPSILKHFIAAGWGLAAAHARGILHGDFKAANVVLDRAGRARVVDFGLASPDPRSDTDRTVRPTDATADLATDELGVEVEGTPGHVAPEVLSGRPRSVASDQFSFCVAAYRALFRRSPYPDTFDPKDFQHPPPAGERAGVPARIERALLRGLDPDPARRHPSMEACLHELSRPGRGRRAAWAVAAAALVLVPALLVLGRGSVAARCEPSQDPDPEIWSDDIARELGDEYAKIDHPQAPEVHAQLVSAIDGYLTSLAQARATACVAREEGRESERVSARRAACFDRAEAAVGELVRLVRSGDRSVLASAIGAVDALPPIEGCEASRVFADDPSAPDEIDAVTLHRAGVIRSGLDTVRLERESGRIMDAIQNAQTLLDEAGAVGRPLLLAEVEVELAAGRIANQEIEEGTRLYRSAYNRALVGGKDRVAARAALGVLAAEAVWRADASGAVWGDHARAHIERLGGDPRLEAERLSLLARGEMIQGHGDKAVELARAAVAMHDQAGPGSFREAARSRLVLARALAEQAGSLESAVQEAKRALQDYVAATSIFHPRAVEALVVLGRLQLDAGNTEEAERLARRAQAVATAVMDAETSVLAEAHNLLGVVLAARGLYTEANRSFREALEVWAHLGEDDVRTRAGELNLAATFRLMGEDTRAEETLAAVLESWERRFPDGHVHLTMARANMGLVELSLGRPGRALELFERVAVEMDESLRRQPNFGAQVEYGLGLAQLELGRPGALTHLERAVALLGQESRSDAFLEAAAPAALARAIKADAPGRARSLAQQALEAYARHPQLRPADRAGLRAWMATFR